MNSYSYIGAFNIAGSEIQSEGNRKSASYMDSSVHTSKFLSD